MNRDTITGIVGAAILVAAMIGVFQYERTIGAASAGVGGAADWQLMNLDGPGIQGSTQLGATSNDVATLAQANVTNVTFLLTWTGQSTNTLALAIDPPDDVSSEVFTQESDRGSITITVAVANAKPSAGPETLGVGDWKFSVQYVGASSTTPSPLPPVGQDESVDWMLSISYDAWAPAPAEA